MKLNWMTALAMAAATASTFFIPDAKLFQEPALARLICFHLPCAFLTTVFLFVMAWNGVKYLRTRQEVADHGCAGATELSMLFALLTLVTGILFSRAQWGAWWQWDQRQTSFLFVCLLIGAGLVLRGAFADAGKAARAGAAYASFSLLPILFLIFVYPRLPAVQQQSFHPSATISKGGFDGNYWASILSVFAVLLWITVSIFRMRIRAGLLQSQAEDIHGLLESGGSSSADTRVVRPVSVSEER